jgi:hypothetical protein
MNKNKIVFVDESGDEGRSEGSSSDYYIVVALIVEEENYRQLLQHFKGVRKRQFLQGSEIKSDTVGNDTVRRKRVITDITQKPFDLSILIVDKRKLTATGFRYSHSFVKYLHGRLYQNVMRDFNFIQFKADTIKSRTFTNEFKSYIEKKSPKTLFSGYSFEFLNSIDNECVQVCDFLAGTIRRCLEQRETIEDKGIYLSHVKERSYIEIFPYSQHEYLYEITGDEKSDFDLQIERRAVEDAYRYINEQKDNTDTDVQQATYCLQLFLSDYFSSNGDSWLATHILQIKLEETFNETFVDQKLRSIIAKLRDNSVLIASKRSGGYKIPTRVTDLYEYLNTQNMTISPMISRIKKASDLVRRATDGNVNILEVEEFRNLKRLVEVLTELV